ncbi:MAG: hypothetical protein WCR67_04175 [Bacilli bacterium]
MFSFKRLFLTIACALAGIATCVSAGFGVWYFSTESQKIQDESKIKTDDIAENYYFASQANDKSLYDVYFFPSPEAAKYNRVIDIEQSAMFGSTVYIKAYAGSGQGTYTYDSEKSMYIKDAAGTLIWDYGWPSPDEVYFGFGGPGHTMTYSTLNKIYLYWKSDAKPTTNNTSKKNKNIDYTKYGKDQIVKNKDETEVDFTYINCNDTSQYIQGTTGSTSHLYSFYTDGFIAKKDGTEYHLDLSAGHDSMVYINATEDYSDPVTYYDSNKNVATPFYKDDKKGFWGTMKEAADGNVDGEAVYDETSSDGAYGYKVFKNVRNQLTISEYQTLGNLFCTRKDNKDGTGWYGYFAGFTDSAVIARKNFVYNSSTANTGYSFSMPFTNYFDLSKPLSSYDTDGDGKIYLYAIYSNGKDYSDMALPSLRTTTSNLSQPPKYLYQEIYAPSEYSYYAADNAAGYEAKSITSKSFKDSDSFGNVDIPWYYANYSVYVGDTKNKVPDQKGWSKDTNYTVGIFGFGEKEKEVNMGDTELNKFTLSADQSAEINSHLTSGYLYNFYFYFNQRYNKDDLENPTMENVFADKNIVYSKVLNKDFNVMRSDAYGYIKMYIERVYEPKITGDITGSFNYSESVTHFPYQSQSNHVTTYETVPMTFSNASHSRFTINYGEVYNASMLSLDESADGQGDEDIVYDGNKDAYKDDDGKTIYYSTNGLKLTGNTASPGEALPILEITEVGVYKIRIKVGFTAGLINSIKISAAKVNGFFMEIFDENPTGKLTSPYQSFVNHADYKYRANLLDDNILTLDDEIFKDKDGNSKTLRTIIGSETAVLYDHVTGARVQITTQGFSLDSGKTFKTSFTLDKNYIFYFASNIS